MRVASWNVAFRNKVAERQGELLRKLAPDLILLQEVNPVSAHVLARAAGADWIVPAVDLRVRAPGERPARSRGVAIAGRGIPRGRAWLPVEVLMPERILAIETSVDGVSLTAVSYHAPPGVTWKLVKPRQAVAFATWLAAQPGPVLLGADANTPLIDAADFAGTRTHWHTGGRNLHGEPGDDLMWGPGKIHHLHDALRCWVAGQPAGAAAPAGGPLGPLAITHRTGKRKNSPGTARRFDSIWITGHWTVNRIDHLYEEGIDARSDHAVIIADLTPAMPAGAPPTRPRTPQPASAHIPSALKPAANRRAAVQRGAARSADEFIPSHYCRKCGWPFTASQQRIYCQAPDACSRRLSLPMSLRAAGSPRNNRVHPEWRPRNS